MNTIKKAVFEQWQEGEVSAEATIETLCQELVAVEDKLEPLEQTVKAIRANLSEVVERAYSGKAIVQGFGQLKITEPSQSVTYPREKIEKLILQLVKEGHPDIAERITQCNTTKSITGSLRIDRLRTR